MSQVDTTDLSATLAVLFPAPLAFLFVMPWLAGKFLAENPSKVFSRRRSNRQSTSPPKPLAASTMGCGSGTIAMICGR
jgi:methylase of polypeptide subunit release factors